MPSKVITGSRVLIAVFALSQLSLSVSTSAQASTSASIRLSVSNRAPEINAKVAVKACWSGLSALADIRLESRAKAGREWTEIQQKNGVRAQLGCTKWLVASNVVGNYLLRVRETVGRRTYATSQSIAMVYEPIPTVALTASSTAPETGSNVQMSTCWQKSFGTAAAKLEVAEGTTQAWHIINQRLDIAASGCVAWNIVAGTLGATSYRVVLIGSGVTNAVSGDVTLTVFGPISTATFFQSELGCNSGTVSNGSFVYPEYCAEFASADASSPSVSAFNKPTTCRSLTLSLMGTDQSSGDTSDTNVDTFEVIQASLAPQTFAFPANQVTSVTIQLDGSAASLQTWDSAPNNYNYAEYIYELQSPSSTADCSTLSGV